MYKKEWVSSNFFKSNYFKVKYTKSQLKFNSRHH